MKLFIERIEVIKRIVNGMPVYCGWIEGKKVRDVAKIVHITREGKYISGYQRSELPKHVESITDYVETANSAILANLVIGFDKSVKFIPASEGSNYGHIEVRYYPEMPSSELPGSIVDGQQRSGGVKNSHHESYPLPVSIFISENKNDYIQQFLILNLGKPLTSVQLNALALNDDIYKPPALAAKAFPLSVCQELGFGGTPGFTPPLEGLIKSNGYPQGVIAESSITEFVSNVERMILKVINIRVNKDLDKDSKALFIEIINNFWVAVTVVFRTDWKQMRSMKSSYIAHGTSIFGFSFLCRHMLRVFLDTKRSNSIEIPSVSFFEKELTLIAHQCHFSSGVWSIGLERSDDEDGTDIRFNRRWNDFQNTTSEKQLFAGNILKIYEVAKGFKTDHAVYFT